MLLLRVRTMESGRHLQRQVAFTTGVSWSKRPLGLLHGTPLLGVFLLSEVRLPLLVVLFHLLKGRPLPSLGVVLEDVQAVSTCGLVGGVEAELVEGAVGEGEGDDWPPRAHLGPPGQPYEFDIRLGSDLVDGVHGDVDHHVRLHAELLVAYQG